MTKRYVTQTTLHNTGSINYIESAERHRERIGRVFYNDRTDRVHGGNWGKSLWTELGTREQREGLSLNLSYIHTQTEENLKRRKPLKSQLLSYLVLD